MLRLAIYLWMTLDFSGSAGGTLESGRTVMAHSDAWSVSCAYEKDTATIKTDGHTIVVAPMELVVDRQVVSAIPESAKSVDVRLRDDIIRISVDGHEIVQCEL